MSTPIEVVKAQWDWMRADYTNGLMAPHGWDEYDAALASVLRDAERFKALERAFSRHNDEGMITVMRWKGQRIWHYTKEPDIDGLTIAELADRLREGKQ